MLVEQELNFREVTDYEVVCSSNGDALLSFMGRTVLPETVEGTLDGDIITIYQTESGSALKFMNLQERQIEILKQAQIIYIARVFSQTISYSILSLNYNIVKT